LPIIRSLIVWDSIQAHAACQVGCEKTLWIESPLDHQEISVARKDAVELFGRQNLVLGKVNLAAAFDRRLDKAVDRLAAGSLVALFRMEFEVEAVTVLGERDQAVVWLVRSQNGRHRWAGG
jgi:hypothetical protein